MIKYRSEMGQTCSMQGDTKNNLVVKIQICNFQNITVQFLGDIFARY